MSARAQAVGVSNSQTIVSTPSSIPHGAKEPDKDFRHVTLKRSSSVRSIRQQQAVVPALASVTCAPPYLSSVRQVRETEKKQRKAVLDVEVATR